MSKKVKEKRTDWLGLWKDVMRASKVEKSQEEEILESSESDEVKKELIKALDKREKAASKMFKNQYKALNIDKDIKKEDVQKAVKKYMNNQNKESKDSERVD